MTSKPLTKVFQERVTAWYRDNGRVFYWRIHKLNTWQWLFLELLLKRTRAERVETEFPSLVAKYFEPKVIVQTYEIELENDLQPLGLQRQRCISLKLISKKIIREYGGETPSDPASLASLPYVGKYISNAVSCFCHGQRRPVVDSNIGRVLTRFHGLDMPTDTREKWLWKLAENVLPEKNWQEYNYGLIDFGAMICLKSKPKCSICCLRDLCIYRKLSKKR